MKAITIHQPSVSLLAVSLIDQLTWTVPPPERLIGKRIAIHAAAIEPDFHDLPTATRIWLHENDAAGRAPQHYPVSAIVCTAVLVGAAQLGARVLTGDILASNWLPRSGDPLLISPSPIGDFSEGRWVWSFTDVIELERPSPAKGRQGWWNWNGADDMPAAPKPQEQIFMDWLHIEFSNPGTSDGLPGAR